jgi:hypothetical protein
MYRASLMLFLTLLVSMSGCGCRREVPVLAMQAKDEKKPEYVLATSIKELETVTKQDQVRDLGKKYPHVNWKGAKATFDEKSGYYLDDVFGQRIYWLGFGGDLNVAQQNDLRQSGTKEQRPGDVLVEFGDKPQLKILVTVKPEVWRLASIDDEIPQKVAEDLIPITAEETKKVKEGESRRIGKSPFHVLREKGRWVLGDQIRYPSDKDHTRSLFRNGRPSIELVTETRDGEPLLKEETDAAIKAIVQAQASAALDTPIYGYNQYKLVESVPPALVRAEARQNPPAIARSEESKEIQSLRESLADADAALIKMTESLNRAHEVQHKQTLLMEEKDGQIRSLHFTIGHLVGRLKSAQPAARKE